MVRNEKSKVIANRHRRKLKQKAVDYKGGRCEVCGYNKCLRALQFHHKDPSKKEFGIGRRKVSDFELLKKELDKCQLLCSNCHAEVHDKISKQKDEEIIERLNIPERNTKGNRKCVKCGKSYPVGDNKKRCNDCVDSFIKKKNISKNKKPKVKTNKSKSNSATKISWPKNIDKLVWTKPLSKLSKDLKVSDVAIKKYCSRRNIPLPKRGYWLKEENKHYL